MIVFIVLIYVKNASSCCMLKLVYLNLYMYQAITVVSVTQDTFHYFPANSIFQCLASKLRLGRSG